MNRLHIITAAAILISIPLLAADLNDELVAVITSGISDNERMEKTRGLLEKGASPDSINAAGVCAIVESTGKDIDLLKLLIQRGGNINIRDGEGYTALIKASQMNDLAIVTFCLEKGANANEQTVNGASALMWSIDNFNSDRSDDRRVIEELLQRKPALEAVNSSGETALMIAAYKNRLLPAALLIKKGADVNRKNNTGETPLLITARHRHIEMAKLLLKNKADVHLKNSDGDTALTYAIRDDSFDVVKLLLEHKADARATNNDGISMLSQARSKKVVTLLIQYGAK